MLKVGALRGTDGTGVFIVGSDKKVRTLKIGDNPYRLMSDAAYTPFLEANKKNYNVTQPQDRFIVGHNRSKTVGEGTTENAHPHRVGDICLVHNGTLRGYSDLPNMKDFAVDSMALASAINDLGIDEAISRTHGAYAIVYYNSKDDTLNFLRNGDRPLAMAFDKSQDRLYFASEMRMLEWILGRNYVDLTKDVKLVNLKVDTLLSFSMDNVEPTVREVKGPPITTYHRGMGYFEYMEAEFMDDVPFVSQGHAPFIQDGYGKWVPRSTLVIPPVVNPKKEVKKLHSVVNKIKKMGVDIKIHQELKGLKKGDQLVFEVKDYADENDEKEKFLVMGETTTLPRTSIRFKLTGVKSLDDLFNHGKCIATVRNIIEYPGTPDDEDQYVIWVNDPQLYFHQETYPLLTYDGQGNPLH